MGEASAGRHGAIWTTFWAAFSCTRPLLSRIGRRLRGRDDVFWTAFDPRFRARGHCFRESGDVCEVGMMCFGPPLTHVFGHAAIAFANRMASEGRYGAIWVAGTDHFPP